MRLLLDTHVLLWVLGAPERLDPATAAAIVLPENEVVASAASAWEIAIRQSLGKLELPGPAETWLPVAVAEHGIEWLDVSPADALAVRGLPWHHRDPFDRLLVAQARRGSWTLVTRNRTLSAYDVAMFRPG